MIKAAEQIVLTYPLLPTRICQSTEASLNNSKTMEVATMLIKEGGKKILLRKTTNYSY